MPSLMWVKYDVRSCHIRKLRSIRNEVFASALLYKNVAGIVEVRGLNNRASSNKMLRRSGLLTLRFEVKTLETL